MSNEPKRGEKAPLEEFFLRCPLEIVSIILRFAGSTSVLKFTACSKALRNSGILSCDSMWAGIVHSRMWSAQLPVFTPMPHDDRSPALRVMARIGRWNQWCREQYLMADTRTNIPSFLRFARSNTPQRGQVLFGTIRMVIALADPHRPRTLMSALLKSMDPIVVSQQSPLVMLSEDLTGLYVLHPPSWRRAGSGRRVVTASPLQQVIFSKRLPESVPMTGASNFRDRFGSMKLQQPAIVSGRRQILQTSASWAAQYQLSEDGEWQPVPGSSLCLPLRNMPLASSATCSSTEDSLPEESKSADEVLAPVGIFRVTKTQVRTPDVMATFVVKSTGERISAADALVIARRQEGGTSTGSTESTSAREVPPIGHVIAVGTSRGALYVWGRLPAGSADRRLSKRGSGVSSGRRSSAAGTVLAASEAISGPYAVLKAPSSHAVNGAAICMIRLIPGTPWIPQSTAGTRGVLWLLGGSLEDGTVGLWREEEGEWHQIYAAAVSVLPPVLNILPLIELGAVAFSSGTVLTVFSFRDATVVEGERDLRPLPLSEELTVQRTPVHRQGWIAPCEASVASCAGSMEGTGSASYIVMAATKSMRRIRLQRGRYDKTKKKTQVLDVDTTALSGHQRPVYMWAFDGTRRLVSVDLLHQLIVWDIVRGRKMTSVDLLAIPTNSGIDSSETESPPISPPSTPYLPPFVPAKLPDMPPEELDIEDLEAFPDLPGTAADSSPEPSSESCLQWSRKPESIMRASEHPPGYRLSDEPEPVDIASLQGFDPYRLTLEAQIRLARGLEKYEQLHKETEGPTASEENPCADDEAIARCLAEEEAAGTDPATGCGRPPSRFSSRRKGWESALGAFLQMSAHMSPSERDTACGEERSASEVEWNRQRSRRDDMRHSTATLATLSPSVNSQRRYLIILHMTPVGILLCFDRPASTLQHWTMGCYTSQGMEDQERIERAMVERERIERETTERETTERETTERETTEPETTERETTERETTERETTEDCDLSALPEGSDCT